MTVPREAVEAKLRARRCTKAGQLDDDHDLWITEGGDLYTVPIPCDSAQLAEILAEMDAALR